MQTHNNRNDLCPENLSPAAAGCHGPVLNKLSESFLSLWDEGSERNLPHTSAPLCHEDVGRVGEKTHFPAES